MSEQAQSQEQTQLQEQLAVSDQSQTQPVVSDQEQTKTSAVSDQSQTQPQTSADQEVSQKRKSHTDRIAELESKIAKMEALYQLQGQNVVDMEVCTDLLLKGYTLDQLKQSKPYLFAQSQTQPSTGTVRQPPKVFAETQTPKSAQNSGSVSSDGFIKTLANMLVSKF